MAKALLRDMVARGLDQERARLIVIDGAKALRSAVGKIFGGLGIAHRCQTHKHVAMLYAVSRVNTALEGRYVIEGELGESGMATANHAGDRRHGRRITHLAGMSADHA